MRPGTKVKMWSPRFKNRPEVEPPGLLKAVGALSILSVVGVLVYAVAQSVSGIEMLGIEAAYVATLHFVLPFGVFYAISANSPFSRLAIATYVVILCSATVSGKGFLGAVQIDETAKMVIAGGILLLVLVWLYGSPKMRFYYAAVSNHPMPPNLASRAKQLHGGSWLKPKARETLAWLLDHLETAVLLGLIVAAVYAVVSTG